MCIHPSIIGSSPIANIISKLNEDAKKSEPGRFVSTLRRLSFVRSSSSSEEPSDLYATLVEKAYGLPDASQAKAFEGPSFVQDGNGRTITANFYNEIQSYSRSLGWVLKQALSVLQATEDADGPQIITGLMCRAARECNARKRFVFCATVHRIPMEQLTYDDEPQGIDLVLQFLVYTKHLSITLTMKRTKRFTAHFMDPICFIQKRFLVTTDYLKTSTSMEFQPF